MNSLLLFLVYANISFSQAAARIVSPVEGSSVSGVNLTVSAVNTAVLPETAQWVVFRLAPTGAWPVVHRAAPVNRQNTVGYSYDQNLLPVGYFCRGTYAIRLMHGNQTLAGPVHFTAGAGACSGTSVNFVNLENRLTDISNFTAVNQLDRDTCGSFAAMAGLEAAYFQFKNERVSLSQHYFHHIVKSSWLNAEPTYRYENQSSYWGGNDTLTALKFMQRYPVPVASQSPYQSQVDLTNLLSDLGLSPLRWSASPATNVTTQEQIDRFEYAPANVSHLARLSAKYGITDYGFEGSASARNPERIEQLLRQGNPLLVGTILRWQASSVQPKTYNYLAGGTGAHLMLIVGFDKTDPSAPYFLVKNSWGDGVIRVAYDVFVNGASGIGWIKGVRDTALFSPTRWIGVWNMQHDHWRGTLTIRRNYEVNLDGYTGYQRIGDYRDHSGKLRCVYGGWANGSTLLRMYINFDSSIETYARWIEAANPRVWAVARDICSPGEKGQYFEINMPLNQNTSSTSGKTWWNRIEFPARLWR